jgi:hypothetical protein
MHKGYFAILADSQIYAVRSINGLILVDIGNKLFTLVVKGFEKERLFAVSTIHSNPGIANARGSGMADNIKGQLRFAFELYIVWNTGCLAALAVICPLFWQVKATADNGCPRPMNQRGVNTGLAIINLAKSSAPLTGNADRFFSFFWQTAFVNNKSCIRTAT